MNLTYVIFITLSLVNMNVTAEDTGPTIKCQDAYKCPDGCGCLGGTVYCNNIATFPKAFPKGMTKVRLKETTIERLPPYAFFGCENLNSIYISYDNISFISRTAFHSLYNLRILELWWTNIQLDKDHIEEGAFDDLHNLSKLTIINMLPIPNLSYRDVLFYNLGNLHSLVLNGCRGKVKFGPGFANVKALTSLYLMYGLDIITNETFLIFQNSSVSELFFMQPELKTVEHLAFAHFRKLEVLFMQWITGIDVVAGLSKAWYGLQFTSISTLHVDQGNDEWHFSKKPVMLDDNFFYYLARTNITKLEFYTDGPVFITADLSKYLPGITQLKMNNVQDYSFNGIISYWHKFEYLDFLSLGGVNYIKKTVFQNITCLMQNEIGHHCMYTKFKVNPLFTANTIVVPPRLSKLKLSNIALMATTVNGPVHIQGHNTLQEISINDCQLDLSTLQILIENPCSLPLTLDFSKNKIKSFKSHIFNESISKGLVIVSLSLSDNLISVSLNNESPFELLSRLTNLSLDNNKITYLPKFYFRGLENITYLTLKKNFIAQFTKNVFANLTTLKILDLSYNAIRYADFSINQLTNLIEINLVYNLVPLINKETLEEFSILHNHYKLKVLLFGNQLVCGCTTLPFIEWLLESNVVPLYGNYDRLYCMYKDKYVSIINLRDSDILQQFRISCASNLYLMWIGILTGILILIISVSVCIYRHRWDLQFLFLKLVAQRKVFQDTRDNTNYEYDAFVAFDQDDFDWVSNELMPNLEHPGEPQEQVPLFRLCVHNRDWAYGTRIEHNIIESVLNSRKTIIVLTPHFVHSNWCQYELEMARTRCFDEGRDIIIVIMLQHVPASAMNSTLRTLVRRVTYLEWPNHDVDRVVFWEKLRRSLQKPSTKVPVCECGRKVYKD